MLITHGLYADRRENIRVFAAQHQQQVTEAKRSLVYTGMSINEIAYELGFKDLAYFSRFFSKMTGQQASQFRKDYQSDQERNEKEDA